MLNPFLQVLKSQASLLFSGKINILLKGNAQFYAVIFLNEGTIVNAQFKEKLGKSAFFTLIIESLKSSFEEKYELVIEPELPSAILGSFKWSFDEALSEFAIYLDGLRPQNKLTLCIKAEDLYASFEDFFPNKKAGLTALLLSLRQEKKLLVNKLR